MHYNACYDQCPARVVEMCTLLHILGIDGLLGPIRTPLARPQPIWPIDVGPVMAKRRTGQKQKNQRLIEKSGRICNRAPRGACP
jgi:hypothetical protein